MTLGRATGVPLDVDADDLIEDPENSAQLRFRPILMTSLTFILGFVH